MNGKKRADSIFLFIVLLLSLGGFFLFLSASLGLLAKDGARFGAIAATQGVWLVVGLGAFFLSSRVHYRFWKRHAALFLFAATLLTAAVFIPFLGFEHGGARRWISLFGFSFQPAEFLKLAVIVYFAAWFSRAAEKIKTVKYGAAPFIAVLGIAAAVLLTQPDTGTFLVVGASSFLIYFLAGGKWRHMLALVLIGTAFAFVFVEAKPYVKERIAVYLNPDADPLGSGWQVKQSEIAIGSGGLFGRGFGKSVQKFTFLPEPIGDSIFAVAAEEFGFVGGVAIIFAFFLFFLRGMRIANRAPDRFGRLLASGIVILITFQAFLNIGTMLGAVPLTGLPLPFISKGGTALLVALTGAGIVLNISRYAVRR